VTGAMYALMSLQKVFQGERDHPQKNGGIGMPDFGKREMIAMIPMMIGLIYIGVYPQPVFDLVNPVLASLYELTGTNSESWVGVLP
jgi:NADH-quinone oxidoreductase subunit M